MIRNLSTKTKCQKKLTMKWGSDTSCKKMVFGESHGDKSSLLRGWNHSFSMLWMMLNKNVTTCSYTGFPPHTRERARLPTISLQLEPNLFHFYQKKDAILPQQSIEFKPIHKGSKRLPNLKQKMPAMCSHRAPVPWRRRAPGLSQ